MMWSESVAKYVQWMEQTEKELGTRHTVKLVCGSCGGKWVESVGKTTPPCPCCGSTEISMHEVKESRIKKKKKEIKKSGMMEEVKEVRKVNKIDSVYVSRHPYSNYADKIKVEMNGSVYVLELNEIRQFLERMPIKIEVKKRGFPRIKLVERE